jgi:sialate O-acetylesterase
MIAPLAGYGMRGALWYQGESNVQRAWQYQVLLRTLIEDWRNAWGYDFPFLVVQLPNYELPGAHTGRSEWAELREAQRLVAASVPGVWMTVNNDTGNSRDIHPANKPLIGYRLALAARANVYGDTHVAWTGPRFARADFEDRRVRVWFTHDEGLCALGDGAEVSGFVIAGGDREFHRATAEITENGVVVHSAAVAAPVAVRYAWAGTPGANLANAYGLPAEGFRTDSWPLLTEGK